MRQDRTSGARDSASRVQSTGLMLVVGVITYVLVAFVLTGLAAQSRISSSTFIILLVLNVFVSAGGGWVAVRVVHGSATRFASMIMAGGNIPYTRQYSEQDALASRGDIEGAIASYRGIIASDPRDLEARLRVGALLARAGGDLAAAEQVFLEVRALAPNPQQVATLSNALIDIYQATGERDKLKVELGRFARRFPGSREGAAAAAHLERLREG